VLAEALTWAKQHPVVAARHPRQTQPHSQSGEPIHRVLIVSHCDFTGNSALHAYRIAGELHKRGLSPAIAVPDDPETVEDLGRPPFPVLAYDEAAAGRFGWPGGQAPDLVHAFTPRERVRRLTTHIVERFSCPYVVHLEDNDRAVLGAELGVSVEQLEELPAPLLDRYVGGGQVHPLRGRHFLEHAAGVSVVIDRLLELAPNDLPTAVVKPGFDEAVLAGEDRRGTVRGQLGLRSGDCAVVYTGTIHITNIPDMRRLYVALGALRRDGHPIVLVKTGWNAPDAPELRQLGEGLRNLGWVPRSTLPGLLAAADIFIQPGVPGPFNDYRFPAKLPDFLAAGKPVVLPRTNLGVELEDGREAVVLEGGSSAEIYRAVEQLRADPERARELGARGREFALRELRWATAGDHVVELYGQLNRGSEPAASVRLEPPVRVLAVVPSEPATSEVTLARRYGIYGFQTESPNGSTVAFTHPDDYRASMRLRVLEALGRAPGREPLVYVDPGHAWADARTRRAWLTATRAGIRDGVRQFYASRGLGLSSRVVNELVAID
jgi:glycosyltransferase involved in cell wall biosynthesis